MFDLGDVVSLSVQIRDNAGALAAAGAVVLTVTLPDDTTATPAVSNPSTGNYTADYTPSQAGRHVARWVATGANASAFTDAFDVREAAPPYIVSLADVRAHLNLSAPTTATERARDEELRRLIESATKVVEDEVGPVVVRTVSNERHLSGYCLQLHHTPVVSLTSVLPWLTSGTTYTVGNLKIDTVTGIVERLDGGYFTGGPFAVTYKAGRPIIPANLTEASLELVRINFRSQLGGSFSEFDTAPGEERPDLGFFVPRGVMALLKPHARGPLVA